MIPKRINEVGGHTRIFMPLYGMINERRHQLHEVIRLSGMNVVINDLDMPLIIKVASIPKERMQVYFIDNDEYFKRKGILKDSKGNLFKDNDERMIFFTKGVIETVKKLNWSPDIIHLHGWFTSLFPIYLKTYFADKLKGYVLTAFLGGGLLLVFVWMIEEIGAEFWWYFWIVITVFLLALNMLYTSLLLPLFNKLVPLEDGKLKKSIADFAEKVSFPLTQVFVIDGSKRSSKGNAFFSGLGKKKKVVLYDTLIDKHSVDELTAVFAHEVGHYKKNHIYIGTFMSIVQTGLMLFYSQK